MSEPKMTGVEMIAKERRRQLEEEGFSAERDDAYHDGELLDAVLCYVAKAAGRQLTLLECDDPWPWSAESDHREQLPSHALLTQAGALIAAELDRRAREEARCCGSCGYQDRSKSFSIYTEHHASNEARHIVFHCTHRRVHADAFMTNQSGCSLYAARNTHLTERRT